MNLATKITVFRLLMVPVGIGLLFLHQVPYNFTLAMLVYLAALFSDIVDGQIARRSRMVTPLGGCLDSMADKLVVLTYFVYLQAAGLYPLWLLELVLAREIIVNGIRSYMISYKPSVGALLAGKWQGALILVSLFIGLLALSIASGQFPAVVPARFLGQCAWYIMLAGFFLSLVIPPGDLIENYNALLAGKKRRLF